MENIETEGGRTILDAAVEHLGMAGALPVEGFKHLQAVVRHPSSTLEFVDLEKHAEAPRQVRQEVTFETPQSFAAYVMGFREERSRIFASLQKMMIVGLVDYHQARSADGKAPTAPSFVNHRAVYPATFAPAFAAWAKAHDKWMSQREFAEFLEDRAEDATNPDPADLMEVAQRFEAVRNVDFRSVVNVSTNERQFRYEEKDSVGGGVAAPRVIALFTPVFQGSDPVSWRARFAYDIADGKLRFKVAIHRFQELLDAEFERLCDAIAIDCPGVPLHRGAAAAAQLAR